MPAFTPLPPRRSSLPPALRIADTARPRSGSRLRQAIPVAPRVPSVVERAAVEHMPCANSLCSADGVEPVRVPAGAGMPFPAAMLCCAECARRAKAARSVTAVEKV